MSTTNGHHIPYDPLNHLDLTAEAVRTLLAGDELSDHWSLERFGMYHDLINRLLLASVAGDQTLRQLWAAESHELPALAALVNGHAYEGVVHVRDLIDDMRQWYEHGSPQGLSPGWPSLAKMYRVAPGQLTVIIGLPSTGKSRWVSDMVVRMAHQHDWRFAIFSPEMAPPKKHLKLLLTQRIGKPFDREHPQRMSWLEAHSGMAWLDEHVSFLWPKRQLPTIEYLLDMSRVQVLTEGVKGLIIDPWNRAAHQRPDHMNETDYIGQSLVYLANFAQEYQVHVFVIAHPTKVLKIEGKYPVVTPNMIAGSANWWNMPDNILSLWRDIDDNQNRRLRLYTQKIRHDESGEMGCMTELLYHPLTARYSEIDTRYGDIV